jgi:hypothetical protein
MRYLLSAGKSTWHFPTRRRSAPAISGSSTSRGRIICIQPSDSLPQNCPFRPAALSCTSPNFRWSAIAGLVASMKQGGFGLGIARGTCPEISIQPASALPAAYQSTKRQISLRRWRMATSRHTLSGSRDQWRKSTARAVQQKCVARAQFGIAALIRSFEGGSARNTATRRHCELAPRGRSLWSSFRMN